MDGCIYQTEEKRCMKFTNGKSQSWCVGKEEPCGYRKPSNADRIRAMTDEELLEWIGWVTQDAFCYGANMRNKMLLFPFGTAESTLQWLKGEAKE